MQLLFILYQLFQFFSLPLFICYMLLRKLKNKPVFGRFSERIGLVPRPTGQNVIWFHAVSVGEVLSLQSFIEKIKQNNPNTTCYLTVGTPTGKKIAQEKLQADVVSFLPYDFLPSMLLAFARIKPKRLIIVEAEIWPNLLMLAHFKKIPLYLINARISKRSKNRYHKFKWVLTKLFNLFEKIYTQSEYDTREFEALGVEKSKLHVLGDIKAYNVLEKQKSPLYPSIHDAKRRTRDERRLLVGSLHPGELDTYINLYCTLKQTHPDLKLTLAPRHFHWKQELIEKIKQTNYSYAVWDQENDPENKNVCDILLVCKLGELFKLYQQATIYFLGGTFVPVGGHNLLEPAVWGKPSIIGPHHHNCQVIAKQLMQHNGLLTVSNEAELIRVTQALLCDPEKIKSMGKNSRLWLEKEGEMVRDNLKTLLFSP